MAERKYLKLRGRIIEKFGTYGDFANSIKMNRSSLACKLNGIRGISKKDIALFCKALDISKQEIGDYFF